ncbi:hypothetical protein PR048_001978 [Dryococelus australis]|uniref:Uncharacterized protein n=1 Tax=Dryococelus australis TaxID=614101 RepID=A0ABQ9IK89_9NEOP|nr:hypothetical protein PR048_001978 [Dryococelus australis]
MACIRIIQTGTRQNYVRNGLISINCANDHPTPLDFKYKKSWYVLEKHFTLVFTRNRNTTDNNEEECLSKIASHDLSKADESRTNENNESNCIPWA